MENNEKLVNLPDSNADAEPKTLAENIVKELFKKQARDIKLYKVTETTVIADYYVICTGRSSTQVRSLSDDIQWEIKEKQAIESRIEGVEASGWILVDFGSVIVHIFNNEMRGFYKLERLLDNSEEIDISNLDIPDGE